MRRKTVLITVIILCELSFLVAPTEATLITIEITGEVTRMRDDRGLLEGKINIGDIITGTYTYDSSTPDSDPRGYAGRYEHYKPPCGICLKVGGFEFKTDPSNVNVVVRIYNDPPLATLVDEYVVVSYNNLPLSNGVLPGKIALSAGSFSNPLSSAALPTTAVNLPGWDEALILCWGAAGEKDFYIEGEITSDTLIPEPATFIMFGLGTLALLRKRKM